MKAVTIVAGLAGTVAAGHAHKHVRNHPRDAGWSSTTTTTTTTSADPSSWTEWDPATTTTTTTTTASTWAEWDPASTTTTTTTTSGWGEWDPKTSSSTTTSSATGWSAWDPSTSAIADPTDGTCAQAVIYITGSGVWGPDPAPSSTATSYATVTVLPTAAPSSVETWTDWTASASTSTSASSSSWSSAWSSASATATSSSSGGSLGATNGETWAMTYSPYTSSGGCKDADTVSTDITAMAGKGFTSVRVYSTDCSTLENVGAAASANSMKMILGIFISSTGISGAAGQVTDILAWKQWDLVELVVIGNEAVFNGYCSASELASFISSTKASLSSAGYTGPSTTTEPIETWLASGTSFCSVIDVVSANLYAFFNAETTADQAGTFIQAEITELEAICSGKDVYVMETGWPHAGNCNGVACPSSANQETAINSIKDVVGAKVVFFSFEDDAWKSPGEFDVEQYWGCSDVFSGN